MVDPRDRPWWVTALWWVAAVVVLLGMAAVVVWDQLRIWFG